MDFVKACFCPCMLCITRARTHGNYLKRTLIPLLMVRKRWTRYQNAWKNVPNMMTEKDWRFYVGKYQYARKRARISALAQFLKMLKMAWNVCKINLRRFRVFLFFARARTYASARVFWPEIDWTDIDLNHDKYEWEMSFRYKDMILSKKYQKKTQNGAWMTSWRVDDLENVTVLSYDNDLCLCQNWTKLT